MRLAYTSHGRFMAGIVTFLFCVTALPMPAFAREEAFIVHEKDKEGMILKSESGRLFYLVTEACNFFEGDTVYIDSTFASWPTNAREVFKHDYKSDISCDINFINEVSKQAFLSKAMQNDNEAVISFAGNDWLVEFDTTCRTTMWLHRERDILVYIDGEFDGVSDKLVMPSGENCGVWSAENIGRTARTAGLAPCPSHAHDNPKDLSTCVCDEGYTIDTEGKSCVATRSCGDHASGVWGSCRCNPGYLWLGDSCISYTKSCKSVFGKHALGDTKSCYCEAGYQLNASKTTCVKNSSIAAKKANKLPQTCGKNRRWRSGECIKVNTCHDSGCAD